MGIILSGMDLAGITESIFTPLATITHGAADKVIGRTTITDAIIMAAATGETTMEEGTTGVEAIMAAVIIKEKI